MEKLIVQTDLDTLEFARKQVETIELALKKEAAKDDRLPLLAQLPGVGYLTALTILAAIGTIDRFADANHLVGYAGLGARVHDSGQVHQNGRITKTGRKDLRRAMVNAANMAVQHHPFWKMELDRLEVRLGRSKAIVAIARKLLVAVWHILANGEKDRHADEQSVAASFINLAYRMGTKNLPDGINVRAFTRQQLDRLKIGAGLKTVRRGSKQIALPPSQLKE